MDIDVLKNRVKQLEPCSENSDDAWGKRIDSEKIFNARIAHKRDSSEYIFYLADFTIFGSAKKSALATEEGISVKYDDSFVPLFIAWNDIDILFYEEESGLNVYSRGKRYILTVCNNKLNGDFIALLVDMIEECKSDYLKLFLNCFKYLDKNMIGDSIPAECSTIIDHCDSLLASTLTSLESKYKDLSNCCIDTFDYLGIINLRSRLLLSIGQNNQAKVDLLDFVEKCRQPEYARDQKTFYEACVLLSEISTESKDFDDALVFLGLAAGVEDPNSHREAKERLSKVSDSKSAYLPEMPKDSRQMILCVEDIPIWPVKEFRFASSVMMRNVKWKFETGHPQVGEMYICHPLRSNHYYEVQSFHDRMFEEKRTELVYLLESIGARHVHVEASASTTIDSEYNSTIVANCSDRVGTGISGQYHKEVNDSSKQDKLQFGIEDRELNPTGQPHIPDDLIWYPHEPAWQRIAQSALANRYKTLSVELKYLEDFSVNKKLMNNVQSSLKLFKSPIEINWNAEVEEHLKLRKEMIWKYTASFDVVATDSVKSHKVTENSSEKEYLEYLNDALCDGNIVESTRRLLERHRIKLGISTERADQLEQSINKPFYTDAEREYLQDLEDCYADGDLNESELRILARRRDKLGISEERAFELNQMLRD